MDYEKISINTRFFKYQSQTVQTGAILSCIIKHIHMVRILFDFEIDTSRPHPYPKKFYDKIRAFYAGCYTKCDTLTALCEQAGCFPVMVLLFTERGIESYPFDIPDFIAFILHRCVKQEHFDLLKDELDKLLLKRNG